MYNVHNSPTKVALAWTDSSTFCSGVHCIHQFNLAAFSNYKFWNEVGTESATMTLHEDRNCGFLWRGKRRILTKQIYLGFYKELLNKVREFLALLQVICHILPFVTHHIKLGITGKSHLGCLELCTPAYSLHPKVSFILIPISSLYHYWFLRY
jgi:hypothetical protein